MALLISDIVCEIREVKLRDKPAEMIAASAKATIPVLVLPDGRVVDESLDIMRWALGRHDPERWLDGDDLPLIEANDGTFKYHLDRYKYSDRYVADSAEHRASGLAMLTHLDARLTSARFLCGEHRSLTDAAIMPFVRQFAQTDRPWFDAQPLPALQRWLAVQLASSLFVRTMIALPQWRAGNAETWVCES